MLFEIYHITHVGNLPGIVRAGGLLSDASMMRPGAAYTNIGYSHIKERRLKQTVKCHPGTTVGEYVPFYFCPRSVMLYVINRGTQDLTYKSGQREIVHLVSTVDTAARLVPVTQLAFTDGNAAAAYTNFYSDLSLLDAKVDWVAVKTNQWNDPAVKEKKQAEFLVRDKFPWNGILSIGVVDEAMRTRALEVLQAVGCDPMPRIEVRPTWYY